MKRSESLNVIERAQSARIKARNDTSSRDSKLVFSRNRLVGGDLRSCQYGDTIWVRINLIGNQLLRPKSRPIVSVNIRQNENKALQEIEIRRTEKNKTELFVSRPPFYLAFRHDAGSHND